MPLTIYDPAINPDPLASGFLTYGQLPTFPIFVQAFPPSSISDITDVFEVAPLSQALSSAGVQLNTRGTLLGISPGYNPVAYYFSDGATKIPTGRFLTPTANEGYAGFSNYNINLDLENVDIFNFNLDSASLVPVNPSFPTVDLDLGFSIEFDLTIAYEQSNPNRAGFSFTLISSDLSKGAEFGFKEAGSYSDYIFIQNANLNASTEGERSTALLEITRSNRYRVTFRGDNYKLSVNGTTLLSGQLRDYSFDPTSSDPPFPTSINPYETQNFIFFGDNTDQGYADFTLGKVVVNSLSSLFTSFPNFNGDGSADIVWRNESGGQVALWLMDNTRFSRLTFINPAVEAEWDVRAVSDLNGDGNPDLVWQNKATNQAAIWLMDGVDLEFGAFLPNDAAAGWKVVESGDFNSNGKDDLLWRNANTGELAVWFMDGADFVSGEFITLNAGLDWEVGAVGDFTNDGKVDIFWENRVNGANAFWKMDGTTFVEGYETTAADARWKAKGAADFNQDGKLDLLWERPGDWGNALWLMDGTDLVNIVNLPSVNPALGWTSAV